jgi:hypothetical protein
MASLLSQRQETLNQGSYSALAHWGAELNQSTDIQSYQEALRHLHRVSKCSASACGARKTGVLAKDGRDYHISTTWIHSLHEYSTLLHKKYVVKQEIRIVDEQTKEIKIHSMYELGHFVLYGLREHFFGEGELYLLHRHLWTVFFNKEKRRVLAEFFAQQKNSFFVAKKSVGDRLFAAYYRRFGKVKLGKSFDEFFDYVIQGDCVAKIHMPEELRHRMDKLYAMRNPFSIKTIDEYSALHYDDYPITVIITRDQGLANDLRKKIRA